MASKGRPFRTVSFEGFEILVGKGDVQNDRLTFDIAEPEDFWLHVGNAPGSHVVVRNPDQLAELPPDVLQHAARLAVHYSKAGGSRRKVEVHICQAADVSKPSDFPPGKVRLRRWQSIKVYGGDSETPVHP